MTTSARVYGLCGQGGAALSCIKDGRALGPIPLIEAARGPAGERCYTLSSATAIERALVIAYDFEPDRIERCGKGLARIAKLLTAGRGVEAQIEVVLLRLPPLAPKGMAKLTELAAFQKANPNWAEEPRNPSGQPDGGEWTDGGDGNPRRRHQDSNVRPAATLMNPVQAMKERFVDAHLADAQKAAKELGVPVENILGLSAVESNGGRSRFANQANNYFGIHYPAPYATGYLQALRGPVKVARFASYADCLKSFVATSGSLVEGEADPENFAAALQNSGKFGIDPTTGAKVPTYVSGVATTIRGLHSIVARRTI
jgi:hypothetical protein